MKWTISSGTCLGKDLYYVRYKIMSAKGEPPPTVSDGSGHCKRVSAPCVPYLGIGLGNTSFGKAECCCAASGYSSDSLEISPNTVRHVVRISYSHMSPIARPPPGVTPPQPWEDILPPSANLCGPLCPPYLTRRNCSPRGKCNEHSLYQSQGFANPIAGIPVEDTGQGPLSQEPATGHRPP